MVVTKIEELKRNIQNYGKDSLPGNKRYHVIIKDCPCSGIHCSYLEGTNNILWLMDSRNSIIAEVNYEDIEEIMVCKDNFWDVLYTEYLKKSE